MKKISVLTVLAFVLVHNLAFAGGHDPKEIIPLLKNSKMTLIEAINYAEQTSGVVTSAKFEISDDGKLAVSVYTVPEGLSVEPETATLTELSGDATEDLSKLGKEVFADKEHLTRASVHMTLFQLSKLSLKQVIAKAVKLRAGQAIDVRNPMMRNHRPVADVIIASDDQNVYVATVDLLNGRVRVVKQ